MMGYGVKATPVFILATIVAAAKRLTFLSPLLLFVLSTLPLSKNGKITTYRNGSVGWPRSVDPVRSAGDVRTRAQGCATR
jgi:hypothetical protein